ncbi:MAG: Stp1/IreP family PP2C-type Ser/Thr phosphatase [Acidimicrobiia bacterium]
MKLVVGAATDVGRVREGNEDGYLVDDSIGLVALADGMGGHLGGEVASATALEALRAALHSGRPLRDAMHDANEAVYAKSLTDPALTGMGTTLTAGTMAAGGTLILAHVGDSRAYLLRDGALTRVTTDHSHVQELVDDGQLTNDEAAVHPMRNIVTRALGLDTAIEVDIYPVELHADDRVVLCSDGLTDMVREDAIAAELRREPDPVKVAHRLIDTANAAGGVDNITVVVVAVSADAEVTGTGVAPLELSDTAAPPHEARLVDEPDALASTATGATGADRDRSSRRAQRRAERGPRDRGRMVKIGLWVVAVVVVIAVAIGAVAWYARNTYYVAFADQKVTVYKGVPGGLLVWNPTVERTTSLTRDDLRAVDASAVSDEKTFSSRGDADAFVQRLRDHADTAATSTTSTSTTTTTTAPATTTVPAPPTTAPGP